MRNTGATVRTGLGLVGSWVKNGIRRNATQIARTAGIVGAKKVEDQLMLHVEKSKETGVGEILGSPVDRIKKMFNGRYIGYYEIPYEAEALTFLDAGGSKGWKVGENAEKPGLLEGGISKIMKAAMPVDFPTVPEWKLDDPIEAQSFETEFTLYNDTFDHLMQNFKFLHAFASGSFWAYQHYKVRAPNMYNIHIPGFMELYFCALDVTVVTHGKLRRLHQGKNGIGKFNERLGVNLPSNAMFPDGYQVTVKVTSLVPNNFNMYLNYLLNGSRDNIKIGDVIPSTTEKIINGVVTAANPVGSLVRSLRKDMDGASISTGTSSSTLQSYGLNGRSMMNRRKR